MHFWLLIEVSGAADNATNTPLTLSQYDTGSSVKNTTSVTTCYHESDVRVSTAVSKTGLRQSSAPSMPPVYGEYGCHAMKTVQNVSP